MTITQNIAISQNSLEDIEKFLHNFVNTHAEIELTHGTIDSDCSQHDETAYLLRSTENRKRLLESIDQVDRGQGTIRELIE